MAADLHPWLEVDGVPTARDRDGLALSSRNTYLSESERLKAGTVPAAIALAQQNAQAGGRSRSCIESIARTKLEQAGMDVDYCEIRSATTLEAPGMDQEPTPADHRIFIAANVGRTRLIDNASLAESIKLGSSLQSITSQGAVTATAASTSVA